MAAAPPPQATPGGLPLPRLTAETGFFWTSGGTGALSFQRCRDCSAWQHPPVPACRRCGSASLEVTPVSGLGTLWTFTTSHQQLLPGLPVPYTVGVVELDGSPELHLTTRLVDVDPVDVVIGMRLRVRFEQHGDVFLPLFEPAA